ncbi:formyltransferase family protein [Desulfovibrio sp.]|uniref:formyltransferase family protein n=1 Tax=Desulfovibrio sp. TaxID=885 RepID=UPI0025B7DD79|nr:formyltransferase family protein [Desulfovibrio sp.]
MNILFLGPECQFIERHLIQKGHAIMRIEGKFDVNFLKKNNFDFCISYRYKSIIKSKEIEWFGKNIINLHIAFLPYNRGYDPNFWSFFENTPRGVTIHIIDNGIDSGDILLQKKIYFDSTKETLRTSYNILSKTIEKLFVDNCEAILLQRIEPRPQKENGTFHLSKDKNRFIYLLDKNSWDTPVSIIEQAGRHFHLGKRNMSNDENS